MRKLCAVATLILIAYAALGPATWQLRPMLGWKTEHFLGFTFVTLIVCWAWPRPLMVGMLLATIAGLLEVLQMLTPDRIADLPTALCSMSGVLVGSVGFASLCYLRRR